MVIRILSKISIYFETECIFSKDSFSNPRKNWRYFCVSSVNKFLDQRENLQFFFLACY